MMVATCMLMQRVSAQSTTIYNDADSKFKTAKEYFQDERYDLAYPLLKEIKNMLPS